MGVELRNRVIMLLQNRDGLERAYRAAMEASEADEDIEALTVRAIDYSRPVIQCHDPGALENRLIDYIYQGKIPDHRKADNLQHLRTLVTMARQVINTAEQLPGNLKDVLRDAYYWKFTPVELNRIYGSKAKFQKELSKAIDALMERLER